MTNAVRTEAANVRSADRIAAIEDVKLDPPILVEMVRPGEEFGVEVVGLDVWHGTWMFGIQLAADDQVELVPAEGRTDPIPLAPDRAGLVRVHGTWYPQGHPHTSWAPEGYPVDANGRVREGR